MNVDSIDESSPPFEHQKGDLKALVNYIISKKIKIIEIDKIIKIKKFNNIEMKRLLNFSAKIKKKIKKIYKELNIEFI